MDVYMSAAGEWVSETPDVASKEVRVMEREVQ